MNSLNESLQEQRELEQINEAVRRDQLRAREEMAKARQWQLEQEAQLRRDREAALLRLKAVLWMVVTAVAYAGTMIGMAILARLGLAAWELTGVMILALGVCGAFRCGCLWQRSRG